MPDFITARAMTEEEAVEAENEFQNDNTVLVMNCYDKDEKLVMTQIESFQTVGFNTRELLTNTNIERCVIRKASEEDLKHFNIE